MVDFFKRLNIYSEGLENVKKLYENGNPDAAFSEYRKVLAKRFSAYPADYFKIYDYPAEEPKLLLSNKISLLGYEPIDLGKPINWLAQPHGDKQWQSHLGYMRWVLPLIAEYKKTGDKRYADKWSEIMNDFLDNHPWGVKGLEYHISRPMYLNEYKFKCGGEGQTPGYLGGSWIGLAASARISNFTVCLAHIMDDEYISDKLISKILLSLAVDHCDVIFNNARRYTPNQFADGACALLKFSILFWEMKEAPAAYLVGMQRFEEAVKAVLLPDGSDLEQSFNYNMGLPRIFYDIYGLFGDSPNERIKKLRADIDKRCKFLFDISNENFEIPSIAKTHACCEKAYFSELEQKYGLNLFGREYKSAAFPYGGYYVSKTDGRYLFFKASRESVGHSHEDCNSIILRADGMPLLIDCSNYNYSDDDDSMAINNYMYSTLAHNSVSVDGLSQITVPFKNALSKEYLKELAEKPIDTLCVVSSEYDAFEGVYDGVYGDASWYSNNRISEGIPKLKVVRAKHNRKVVYLKMADVYIVIDRVFADKQHKYTVSWNIAPEYLPEDVLTDGEIRIRKTGMPSLLIKSFSDIPAVFEKFYGDKLKGRYCVSYGKTEKCVHVEQSYTAKNLTAVHILAPDFSESFESSKLSGDIFEFNCDGKKYRLNINTLKYEVN